MKFPRSKRLSKRLGSALVMTLVIVVLITVVTVGYLASVMLETKTAGASLEQERAYGVAMIGVHEAMSRLRDALGPWDDPYKNFATNAPPFYWSLSPGRITRWSYTSENPLANFALFSESSGTNLVNLNRALADGSYPIIGGASPPDVSVKWANLLRDPSQTAGSNNTIIGRYAFWVDDEGAKININTADGTEKYTTNSLGVGSPSEVSLEVLFAGTNGKAPSKEIVRMARTNGFRSPQEILSATNVPPQAYTNNVFAITTYSRSPDLNVFGQPKMALLPIIGGANEFAINMALNGITLRPPTEIYPTPSQLPGYKLTNRYLDAVDTRSWPLAFRQNRTDFTTGRNNPDYHSIRTTSTQLDNYCYVNGWMLANYLAGKNAAGTTVTWPAFPGPAGSTLTGGFAGKYTPRQIDNIVAQIVSLGSRAISSDFPYNSGNGGDAALVMEQTGMRYNVSPNLFPGWLSDELVIGMGRSMKLTKMLFKVTAYGSQASVTPPVPKARLDIWLEWWIPGAYRGGNPILPINGAAKIFNGNRGFPGVLNDKDLCASLDLTGPVPDPPGYDYLAASLPRIDNATKNYWGNQMLRNNQGIDFAANPAVRHDPDQPMAAFHHDPWAKDSAGPQYMGAGSGTTEIGLNDTPFRMHFLQTHAPAVEWKPGEMRSNKNRIAPNVRYPMRADASGNLVIEGGIAVRSQIKDGSLSDPEPVPLDGARGPYRRGAHDTNEPLRSAYGPFEWYAQPEYWAIEAVAGKPKGTLRQRILDAVIPVNVTVGIPAPESSTGNVKYVLASVKGKDPLVNKFPGDWSLEEATAPPPQFIDAYSGEDVLYNTYGEGALRASMTGPNLDPDSYWMPQADCALTQSDPSPSSNLAKQTLIFRSARMPNIGYLQYLRTGIIPDDEEKPYIAQEGVPFRLLSFAPSTEASNAGNPLVGQRTTLGSSRAYPDWALLDLLYIPSMLNSYGPGEGGGPYNALTNLSYFGTSGGATSGRINPNGAIIYTTDVNTPQAGVSRTIPLQAVLNGVRVNQTFNGTAANPELWPYTGGTEMDSAESLRIAEAIGKYIRDKGPLRIPSEICNVPEVAALRAPVNSTRNDLVRQIVGNLTTQDNVFSVWTVGQSILKRKGSVNYGEFEAGDTVLAEVRLRFVVERYLDPGADGFYGNSASKGEDNIAGTYDDPMDTVNHPFQPKYLYRVVASEEVR